MYFWSSKCVYIILDALVDCSRSIPFFSENLQCIQRTNENFCIVELEIVSTDMQFYKYSSYVGSRYVPEIRSRVVIIK